MKEAFDVLTVVSPSCCGDEPKDQDRARWFPATHVACVADGVTSSAHSEKAAELVCNLSPILFSGTPSERLGAISAVLTTQRIEAQKSPIDLPSDTVDSMKSILLEAVKVRLAQSFQTTFVATCITQADDELAIDICACGDSGFFAFSPDGDLLSTYPDFDKPLGDNPSNNHRMMSFSPGDELLVKIVERVSERPDLQNQLSISSQTAHNWLVCRPLDHCGKRTGITNKCVDKMFNIALNEELVAPRHLIGVTPNNIRKGYCALPYSSLIKQTAKTPSQTIFDDKGAVTAVLPDHYPKRWTYRQERFAKNTNFILCSDGLYEAFRNPNELWEWLYDNESSLADIQLRKQILRELHERRDRAKGDDDISFVWIKENLLHKEQTNEYSTG